MKISVIVTTYNAEATIIDALTSVMNQSYQDFEVVIVDDGSKDSTIEKVQSYLSNISNDKIKHHLLPHLGRAYALHAAIHFAQYDWVAIIDADDLWHADKLAQQVQYIEKYKLDFLATKSCVFHQNDDIDLFKASAGPTCAKIDTITLNKMLYMNFITHASVLGRKDYFQYARKRKMQLDYELWLRSLYQGKQIHMLDQCLTFHRIHKHQSFEAHKHFRYALSATLLQLKYCVLQLKPIPALFVLIKFLYYIFLPRKIRLFVRQIILLSYS